MGIQTVAVYSDADASARHVREADEAIRIGPAKALASYLDARAVLDAARQSGAQAIHPGYGFLSERLDLIDACEKANITFIGPHRQAIASMGSKIESKRLARGLGVACVPGYDGDDQDLNRLRSAALRIGFPLLIKASAGGGGKGMRLVESDSDFLVQLGMAKAEAQAAFGDDSVLLEKYILRPRHVEIQLLGDKRGHLVHLFERECSIQRNYQKLIEEAPANHLEEGVKRAMFDAALLLGRQIGYDSAGTVEFVLDADCQNAPYFLEMNTRLQVEHPVTELTTGLDLVEWQIRSAAGQALGFEQTDIRQHGWAVEARVNAECPEEDFSPSFGPVRSYAAPVTEGVRIDSGIDQKSEITPHYDSLVAKVIGWGATRQAAIERLQLGLRALRIEGISTTQRLLLDILSASEFDDVLTTRFLAHRYPGGVPAERSLANGGRAAAAAAWMLEQFPKSTRPMESLIGWRVPSSVTGPGYSRVSVADEGGAQLLRVQPGLRATVVSNELGSFELRRDGTDRWCLDSDRSVFNATVEDGGSVAVWSQGWSRRYLVGLKSSLAARRAQEGASENDVRAELPGVLAQLLVSVGDTVSTGSPIAVLEAMKLFHTLVAPKTGRIGKLPVAVGTTVAKGAVLVEIEPEPET
jgi:3-methylcrotonyl-CoA carboxylase alpha subunit